jgi:hypothetical protein
MLLIFASVWCNLFEGVQAKEIMDVAIMVSAPVKNGCISVFACKIGKVWSYNPAFAKTFLYLIYCIDHVDLLFSGTLKNTIV